MSNFRSNEERNAKIYGLWNDGLSVAAIARELKLSAETIRLIVLQMDRQTIWRQIERNAQRERVTVLGRALSRIWISFKSAG
jgi:DNA-binding NarL/FixJ family response regulator